MATESLRPTRKEHCMKKRRTTLAAYGLIAILLAVVTGVAAQSVNKVLTTPPLFVVAGESVTCGVVNAGGSQVWVTVSVINSAGDSVDSALIPVPPGASIENNHLVVENGSDRYYCKFECSGTVCDLRASIAHFVADSDLNGYPATSSDPQ